ncbi:MAG: hypothetical protein OHK0053_27170 [Microscillaceae bacterium]
MAHSFSSDTQAFLRYVLDFFNISVLREEERFIYLEKGYCIEIENDQLFKLLSEGSVIAPFHDVEELCDFIRSGG